ncbi:STAS domain-containing protein [Nonomuraea sp. MG754425]|uniref:STAS domain-containing protein n=1 Tax=Nonomuraea sp. MG754425 TaxID=2570319 RepID=UPI001F3A5B13|nr:STAS domain-containing protein [Nonomuraea sp. MG754425]MCF6476803.1 STAS domain-containing protein [Nonomuraea sp. MG754425]
MTERLRITEVHLDSRVTVVTVTGELDMDTCPLLQAALARALPRVAIDLSALTSADSYGLTVLIAMHQHARASGGRALVCGAGDLIRAVFRQRGLDRVLELRPVLAEAVAELRAL